MSSAISGLLILGSWLAGLIVLKRSEKLELALIDAGVWAYIVFDTITSPIYFPKPTNYIVIIVATIVLTVGPYVYLKEYTRSDLLSKLRIAKSNLALIVSYGELAVGLFALVLVTEFIRAGVEDTQYIPKLGPLLSILDYTLIVVLSISFGLLGFVLCVDGIRRASTATAQPTQDGQT